MIYFCFYKKVAARHTRDSVIKNIAIQLHYFCNYEDTQRKQDFFTDLNSLFPGFTTWVPLAQNLFDSNTARIEWLLDKCHHHYENNKKRFGDKAAHADAHQRRTEEIRMDQIKCWQM